MSQNAYFHTLDLTQIPAPDFVEEVSYEAIRQAAIAKLKALEPNYSVLESDPAIKVIEAFCYREFLLRQRINDAARANNIVSARGHDLDVMGAFANVMRLDGETDTRFRSRIQQALSGLSTAGPRRAYLFHTMSVSTAIVHANVDSQNLGEVNISLLAYEDVKDGTEEETVIGRALFAQPEQSAFTRILCRPDHEILKMVRARLNQEDLRPLTDHVVVSMAVPKPYSIAAKLTIYPGPDQGVVKEQSLKRLKAYLQEVQKVGYSATRSGLIAALTSTGIQNVVLEAPSVDQLCKSFEIALATDIAVEIDHVSV
ncbi:baseplate J/gp47 family protein [Bartonella sp. DGB2]|uniref:baseplate assembly protein n=1 Tax=Bartonella sp. DGB2 TaxID=3388426 RepID=UPI00398FE523